MDTGLDQNKAELAVLVLAVALKVLADSHSLRRTAGLDSDKLMIYNER